jgi:hypothetical protein
LLGLVGCGDAMLPSDFSGPPAAAVSGNVVVPVPGASKDATRPRLSLEWWTGLTGQSTIGGALIGQPLVYKRSARLENDWEIGLQLPSDAATWSSSVVGGMGEVKLGVAKMVYFDDRVPDDRLDWACRAGSCDQVKAVSAEYVVFVERPPTCQPNGGGPLRARISAGYHYYRLDSGIIRELARGDAMSFPVSQRTLGESDPTAELRAFAWMLLRSWSLSPFEGC